MCWQRLRMVRRQTAQHCTLLCALLLLHRLRHARVGVQHRLRCLRLCRRLLHGLSKRWVHLPDPRRRCLLLQHRQSRHGHCQLLPRSRNHRHHVATWDFLWRGRESGNGTCL
jgi:hypothetical protein